MLSKADYTLNYYNFKYNFFILQKTETEAAAYFGIGEKKLHRLIEIHRQNGLYKTVLNT